VDSKHKALNTIVAVPFLHQIMDLSRHHTSGRFTT
jgi:hypothetical protein